MVHLLVSKSINKRFSTADVVVVVVVVVIVVEIIVNPRFSRTSRLRRPSFVSIETIRIHIVFPCRLVGTSASIDPHADAKGIDGEGHPEAA
jgi:hypothetical protein